MMFKKGDRVRIREDADVEFEFMKEDLGLEGEVIFTGNRDDGGQMVYVLYDRGLMGWQDTDLDLVEVRE